MLCIFLQLTQPKMGFKTNAVGHLIFLYFYYTKDIYIFVPYYTKEHIFVLKTSCLTMIDNLNIKNLCKMSGVSYCLFISINKLIQKTEVYRKET